MTTPYSTGLDVTLASRFVSEASFMQTLLEAAVAKAGGEIHLTHQELGEAAIAGIEISHVPGGVLVRLLKNRPGE